MTPAEGGGQAPRPLRFDVFGRIVEIARDGERWTVHDLGDDGKRRLSRDIVVPGDLPASTLGQYLDDLCHERATPHHPRVARLE